VVPFESSTSFISNIKYHFHSLPEGILYSMCTGAIYNDIYRNKVLLTGV